MPRYLYELPEWPAFRWDAATLEAPLESVHVRQGRLFGRLRSLGISLQQEAKLATLTEEILRTSEIEGEFLAPRAVQSSLAVRLGIDLENQTPGGPEVDGIVDLMLDATRGFEQPLTTDRLWGWHRLLLPPGTRHAARLRVGDWRHDEMGPMQVVSGAIGRERVHYQAPAADLVPAEMSRFLEWYNADAGQDQVVRAGLAQIWFVMIHPFDDGNGRIARSISEMTLARSDRSPHRFYSMSAQIMRERKEYYRLLEEAGKGSLEITAWLSWFLGCLGRAIESADALLELVLQKARFWDAAGASTLNDRQRKVLNRLLDGFEGNLTTSKWAKLAKCSQDTAARDIDELTQRGLLARNPGGGRSTSYRLVIPAEPEG
ncbi:MAG: Fic family protein [bacterium]